MAFHSVLHWALRWPYSRDPALPCDGPRQKPEDPDPIHNRPDEAPAFAGRPEEALNLPGRGDRCKDRR